MELEVQTQLIRLAAALATGAALGLIYDFFRALRRKLGGDWLFDILFSLAALYALFTLGMSVGGGALHIFMAAFALLGFGIYIALPSRVFFPVFEHIAAIVSDIFTAAKKVAKKFADLVKNVFPNLRSWFTMLKINERKARDDAIEIEAAADRRTDNCGTADICRSRSCPNGRFTQGCRGYDGASKVRCGDRQKRDRGAF